MNTLTLHACIVSQIDAATWSASARRQAEFAADPARAGAREMHLAFAKKDQQIAAKLSLADRTFRGLEG